MEVARYKEKNLSIYFRLKPNFAPALREVFDSFLLGEPRRQAYHVALLVAFIANRAGMTQAPALASAYYMRGLFSIDGEACPRTSRALGEAARLRALPREDCAYGARLLEEVASVLPAGCDLTAQLDALPGVGDLALMIAVYALLLLGEEFTADPEDFCTDEVQLPGEFYFPLAGYGQPLQQAQECVRSTMITLAEGYCVELLRRQGVREEARKKAKECGRVIDDEPSDDERESYIDNLTGIMEGMVALPSLQDLAERLRRLAI